MTDSLGVLKAKVEGEIERLLATNNGRASIAYRIVALRWVLREIEALPLEEGKIVHAVEASPTHYQSDRDAYHPAWENCRKGSCQRHEGCMYTPCFVTRTPTIQPVPYPDWLYIIADAVEKGGHERLAQDLRREHILGTNGVWEPDVAKLIVAALRTPDDAHPRAFDWRTAFDAGEPDPIVGDTPPSCPSCGGAMELRCSLAWTGGAVPEPSHDEWYWECEPCNRSPATVDLCPVCGAAGPDDPNAACQYPCDGGCVRELGR